MRFDDLADDRQAESSTARGGPLAAPEAVEDMRPVFGRYARPAVAHADGAIRGDLDDHLRVARRMSERIFDEVA